MFSDSDLQLKLLTKNPIYVNKIPIYPVSIEKIADFGYGRYSAFLYIFCTTSIQASEFLKYQSENSITDEIIYGLILKMLEMDLEIRELVLSGLSTITKSEILFNANDGLIINSSAITIDEFVEMQQMVRIRNGLKELSELDENPANIKTKMILAHRKKYREKLKEKQGDSDLSLGDLVSTLTVGLRMTLFDVMQYDLYQFNDQFSRHDIFKEYDFNVLALLHGAKSEDIQLHHYARKIGNGD